VTPGPWPADRASAAAILASVIQDIDERGKDDDDTLLADFLCTAWPTPWTQRQ
jgi:hypothetical protein